MRRWERVQWIGTSLRVRRTLSGGPITGGESVHLCMCGVNMEAEARQHAHLGTSLRVRSEPETVRVDRGKDGASPRARLE